MQRSEVSGAPENSGGEGPGEKIHDSDTLRQEAVRYRKWLHLSKTNKKEI